MQQKLINHNADLKRLQDEGYEIQKCGGYLVIHHIPYVNSNKEVKLGKLISELNLVNETTVGSPTTHQIYFSGELPCDIEGHVITAIQHSSPNTVLHEKICGNHYFSNKPTGSAGYGNYYDKVKNYATIISSPAKILDSTVTEKTFKVIADLDEETPFHYVDTNSSRASIYQINSKLANQKVAVIGLGGTGAYILDLLAKTPVKEIHLFDGDIFHQHNAFRSPGAASIEQLNKQMKKVDYYAEMYSKMHKHIIAHGNYIDEDNLGELDQMSFVFIAVDKNSVRKLVMDYLIKANIPVIDVGLGVNTVDDYLIGTVRVTTVTSSKHDHLPNRIASEDTVNDDYNSNIQIADLNALNATLAIIKWKKLSEFYHDLKREFHTTYSINVSQLLNDDLETPIY